MCVSYGAVTEILLAHSIYQDVFSTTVSSQAHSFCLMLLTLSVQRRWIEFCWAKPCAVQGLCIDFGIEIGAHASYSKAFYPYKRWQNSKEKHINSELILCRVTAWLKVPESCKTINIVFWLIMCSSTGKSPQVCSVCYVSSINWKERGTFMEQLYPVLASSSQPCWTHWGMECERTCPSRHKFLFKQTSAQTLLSALFGIIPVLLDVLPHFLYTEYTLLLTIF